jgi:hypothetical protein
MTLFFSFSFQIMAGEGDRGDMLNMDG